MTSVLWLKPMETLIPLASLIILLHRLRTLQKPNVLIRYILNKFYEAIRNSMITQDSR